MEYGQIPGIKKPVSRLVQGTVMISTNELERSFALLDGVLAAGCTTFDTAHVYGRGDSERALGKWIQERGIREKVVILDKGAHPSAGSKAHARGNRLVESGKRLKRFSP